VNLEMKEVNEPGNSIDDVVSPQKVEDWRSDKACSLCLANDAFSLATELQKQLNCIVYRTQKFTRKDV